MKFYVGLHHPSAAHRFKRAFISVNSLWNRKGNFDVNEWILDSGAFSELAIHGDYRSERSVENYARQVERWAKCGNLLKVVSQDYMVEPFMLEKTGGTVNKHQERTIERYVHLHRLIGDLIMPCLQGWEAGDYIKHLEMYGANLKDGEWVGVGSVCKRKNQSSIASILAAIKSKRPDLKLHGFGLKTTALQSAYVYDNLESADSMAWSFAARVEGRNPNCWKEAERFRKKIESQPKQEDFGWHG